MSTISTHVLDTALGRPAAGVPVALERVRDADGGAASGTRPSALGSGATDADGRLRDLLPPGATLGEGTYRLTFAVGDYLERTWGYAFYPEITVLFRVGGHDEHYHVPLLLSPYGYATYRGS